MALTRNSRHTIIERIRQQPSFAEALLDEAQTAFVHGEPGLARLTLRDLIHGTVGFEPLAKVLQIPSKSLHRMLSARGNPCMEHLSRIFDVLHTEIERLVRNRKEEESLVKEFRDRIEATITDRLSLHKEQ